MVNGDGYKQLLYEDSLGTGGVKAVGKVRAVVTPMNR